MPHQCRERGRVRIPRGIAKRTQQFDRARDRDGAPIADLNARKAGVILLHPVRRKTGSAVLPGAEPEDDKMHVVLSGLGDYAIDLGVIERSFFRLKLRPGDAYERGVQVGGDKLWPDGLHLGETGGCVVGEFSREGQKRFAIHDQLGGCALFPQVRDAIIRLRPGRNRGSGNTRKQAKYGYRIHLHSHTSLLFESPKQQAELRAVYYSFSSCRCCLWCWLCRQKRKWKLPRPV